MRPILAVAVLFLGCAHEQAARGADLARWRAGHPAAAQQLCSMARDYPLASMRLRSWISDHPIQAQELLDWAADHPASTLPMAFLDTHPGWDGYLPWRDPGIYALFGWASENPEAARTLAERPGTMASALEATGC